MADYKHGTYGEFAESIGGVANDSGTAAVYVGAAPVNLIRGYANSVNNPVKLTDFAGVQKHFGYSKNWDSFDLCEAFKTNFDNSMGNIGPIVAINVLDPDEHKKAGTTTVPLVFVHGRAYIVSDTIILDTLVLADKVEGIDYSVSYDFINGRVIIKNLGDDITGATVQATYNEVDPSAVNVAEIIGEASEDGVYTGLGCIKLIYQKCGVKPNLILCPKWSEKPEVYTAMLSAASKINGHWNADVYADIPILDGDNKVDTRAAAKAWQEANGYVDENSKVYWPQGVGTDGNVHHVSVLAAWRTQMVDATHNGIPMESPSNKALPVAKQYFGVGSSNRGFDHNQGNDLNESGITTIVYWGGQWVLWGPHTAAYKHGAVTDYRNVFDTSIRMMKHILNSFQEEHALTIDRPMTRAMADTIKNREQEKADALVAVGALIGTPVVEFRESANSVAELVEGNFTWDIKGTPTPPWKSGTLNVAYTTAGFDSYFGEVE